MRWYRSVSNITLNFCKRKQCVSCFIFYPLKSNKPQTWEKSYTKWDGRHNNDNNSTQNIHVNVHEKINLWKIRARQLARQPNKWTTSNANVDVRAPAQSARCREVKVSAYIHTDTYTCTHLARGCFCLFAKVCHSYTFPCYFHSISTHSQAICMQNQYIRICWCRCLRICIVFVHTHLQAQQILFCCHGTTCICVSTFTSFHGKAEAPRWMNENKKKEEEKKQKLVWSSAWHEDKRPNRPCFFREKN